MISIIVHKNLYTERKRRSEMFNVDKSNDCLNKNEL